MTSLTICDDIKNRMAWQSEQVLGRLSLSVLRQGRRDGERGGEDIALRSEVFCMRRFHQLAACLIR